MSKQDRQGARTVSDLERRHAFDKKFAEVLGIATDARTEAQEAKKVATNITETSDGLSLNVKSLTEDMVSVKAELEMKVGTDESGNLKSKMHVGADVMTIDTGNFKLKEDGTIEATNGKFSGDLTSTREDERLLQYIASLQNGLVKVQQPNVWAEIVDFVTYHYHPVLVCNDQFVVAIRLDKDDNASIVVKNKSFFNGLE